MKWILAVVIAAAAFAQDQTGSLQGTVTDSVTHLPVRKARITLFPQGPMRMPRPASASRPGAGSMTFTQPQTPTATADGGGNFVINGLVPGKYGVHAEHPAYPNPGAMGTRQTTVEVAAGEEPARVSLELAPGATITGRIVDEDGDPLPDCYVQAVKPPSSGPNQWVPSLGAEGSNDQGVYRIHGIAPVKVMVLANCGMPVFQPRPLSPVDSSSSYSGVPYSPWFYPGANLLVYVPQYYPGVPEVSSAQAIQLTAGAVREGIDFQMRPARSYTVKGTIRVLPGAKSPERSAIGVALMKRNPSGGPVGSMAERGGGIDWSSGTFAIPGVLPGAYTVNAMGLGLVADIDVVDKDVEVTLELRPPIDLKGSVVVEGDSRTPITRCNFMLTTEDRMGGGSSNFTPKDDGSFSVPGLNAARYNLRVYPMDLFVKSVTIGGQDVPGGVIDLRNGASEVRLVLSSKTATIEGKAPPGRMVQVMSPGDLMNFSLGTAADERGAFRIGQLAPGKYRVVLDNAWEDAQEITVAEGETATVELKAPVAQ